MKIAYSRSSNKEKTRLIKSRKIGEEKHFWNAGIEISKNVLLYKCNENTT